MRPEFNVKKVNDHRSDMVNGFILLILTLEMLGCFLDQDLNLVVARFTSLASFFALFFALIPVVSDEVRRLQDISHMVRRLNEPGDIGEQKANPPGFLAGCIIEVLIRDRELLAVAAGSAMALLNLFLIGSNKGAFLTAADVLMAAYLIGRLGFTEKERFYFAALGSAFLLWWYCTVRWYFNFNMTGMIFMLTSFMAMLLMEHLRAKSRRFSYLGFVQVIACVVATLLCLLYHARCVLAGMLVFCVLYLFMPVICRNRFLRIALVFAATAGSILFTLLYIRLDSLGLNITILYKDVLSGRQLIWKELWEALSKMPLTGIGSSYHLNSFFIFEVHNGMFDILAVHGVPVFLCVLWVLSHRLYKVLRAAGQGDSLKKTTPSAKEAGTRSEQPADISRRGKLQGMNSKTGEVDKHQDVKQNTGEVDKPQSMNNYIGKVDKPQSTNNYIGEIDKPQSMNRYTRICLSGAFAILFTSYFENFFINSPYLLIFLILLEVAKQPPIGYTIRSAGTGTGAGL